MRVRGLRKQLSVLRALGTESRSMISAALTDTSVGLILAALIGGSIGATLAVLLQNIPLVYMGLSTAQLWSRLPVFLIIPWNLVFGIVGIAVTVSILATYVVLNRTLKLNIAGELQYTE
ncbi:MAG: FtsX-like permease family protein [Candidatus Thorarchaeota archaeon]